MDIDIKDLAIYFSLALTLINLYKMLVTNRQEGHDSNLKETDKAFAEFVKTYAGQYSEIKTKVEYLAEDVKALHEAYNKLSKEFVEVKTKIDIHTSTRGGGE